MPANSDPVHVAVAVAVAGRGLQTGDAGDAEPGGHGAARLLWVAVPAQEPLQSATDTGPSVDCVRELEANCIFQSPSAPHDPRA